jgi:hypothetical protein
MNRKRLPSGRKRGQRCEVSFVPGSRAVTGVASPPEAGTLWIRPPPSGAKTIRLCDPQLPPRWSGASANSRAGPPARSTRFSFFSAKNAIERPSGEKKGASAPSLPGRALASRSPTLRT